MTRFCSSAALLFAVLAAAGCGSNVALKGVVTLDGTPVEGATVTFVSESGSDTFSGATNAKGEFTLAGTDQKPGVKPGTYKVIVTKVSSKGEPMAPSADNMKEMQKAMQESAKDATKPKAGGPMMPMTPMAGGKMGAAPVGGGVKSELPHEYGSTTSTPLKVTVPPPQQPVMIELKSKP